jgi:hypothetical protein
MTGEADQRWAVYGSKTEMENVKNMTTGPTRHSLSEN